MKKHSHPVPDLSRRPSFITASRRSFLFTLILITSVLTLAVAGGLLPTGRSASRPDQTPSAGQQSIAAAVMQQIQALEDEKESRTPAQKKISSQLLYATKMERAQPIASGVSSLQVDVGASEQGRVVVDISASVDENLLQFLASRGAVVLVSTPEYHSVRAEVSLDRLEDIAGSDSVYFIQPKMEYMLNDVTTTPGPVDRIRADSSFNARAERIRAQLTRALAKPADDDEPIDPGFLASVGSRQSEGDVTHRANTARGAFNVDGTGIKIGVLSNGVTSLALAQSTGDVGPVTILTGQAGNGDEGTAILEIIHDLAPGAQLFFATANSTPGTFATNIRNLRAAGCDIIVDDIFYFVENPFQDGQATGIVSNTNGGAVLQAVNEVTAAGALYFSSAGNQGNKDANTSSCFQGDFVDGGPNAVIGPGGTVNNFGGGTLFNAVTQASGNPVNLYWADPLGASSNDYDLFVLNATGTAIVIASTDVQSGTQDPFEQVPAQDVNNRIVVFKKTGAANRFFHITINANGLGRLNFNTEGTTKGHSTAADAYGVAAAPAAIAGGTGPAGPYPGPFAGTSALETFTSDGPRRIFFNSVGAAITPGNFSSTGGLVRQKPDITAADGVSVTGVGGFATTFYGTSAAAPHAAAIAALIKQAKPGITAAQLRTALTSSAFDVSTGGVDRNSGAGIIMAYQALQAAGATGQANLQAGTITSTDAGGNANGIVEPGEQATLTVQLTNPEGINPATAISSTLSAVTPGVVITQGSSTYPDIPINGNGSNATPFTFVVSSAINCTIINFNLTVNYTGGASPKVFPVSLALSRTITETLDNTTAPASGAPVFTASTGLQIGRLTRNGLSSSCGLIKSSPGFNDTVPNRRFDAYTFANNTGSPICVTVTLTATSTPLIYSAAYAPTFDPAASASNFLGDPGSSSSTGSPVSYSFTAPANSNFVIVVHEVTAGSVGGTPVPYTLKVDGVPPPCAAVPTVNQPPVNTVPGAQSLIENSQLVFSAANGNAISIADPDAGSIPVQVTLTATNGLISLPFVTGVSFTVGTGLNSPTMTFTGTVAAINTALQVLRFVPSTTNFVGAASLTINTNDLGFTGSGGAKIDNDVITINVVPGSAFNFSAIPYFVGESDGQVVVTVTRVGDLSTAASVNYATSNGTATDRSDYEAAFGTLQFAPGQFSATLPILINEDSLVELGGSENFFLSLSNPQGTSVALGLQSSSVVIILDNVPEPATNPIDDSTNFVRQHYHDFLNREPDGPGLAFWVNNIESCGANAACREVKRIDTSASFFLSTEFQQTGFLSYRTHAAAFGTSRVISTVPLTQQEFLADTQQLGKGVIIGNPGADAQLEANKVAYFNQFVTRPEFVTKYPAGLTNDQYVDNLLASAGLSPSQVRLFLVNLTNDQEVPPANPTKTVGGVRPASFGNARFQFNAAQTAMTMTVTISNIDVLPSFSFLQGQSADGNDDLVAAHIHAGPTVAPGVNGPVVWGFFGVPFNDNNPRDLVFSPTPGGVGATFTAKWDAPEGNGTTLLAQLANLRAGRAYINFHTVQFGGGEIRGNFPAEDTFRNSLIAGLNAGTETRATVLRKVAEQEELGLREFNRAFVLMQYFGYLRRNPNDPPDADFSGYAFWLNKLNTFNGDFRAAEMVKAFITSIEYRQRFGLN
jgi:Calx-beta domain/CHRD domain/Subtilase family